MGRRNFLLAGLFFLLLSRASWAQDKVITWASNPQYPPYGWAADDVAYAGACAELMSLIAPKGYVFRPVVVPWVRAQEMAKRGEIDILVNLRITAERSAWLKFSKNPSFHNPIVIFMRKDRAIPFKSWDELKRLRGGATLGDAFGNGFDDYAKKNLEIDVIPKLGGNFLKLDSGRIDYFVTGYYLGMAWLSHAGFQERIVVLSPPVSNASIHLGFSKLSPRLEALSEIDQSLARLGADGSLSRILEKHLKSFADKPLPVFVD